MSYEEALGAAGADIIDSQHFGSYQGDALFHVRYEGQRGYVTISYGSCSGCDAFEGAFGYSDYPLDRDKLAAFGRSYLDDGQVQPYELASALHARNLDWDYEAQAIVRWLDEQENKQKETLA